MCLYNFAAFSFYSLVSDGWVASIFSQSLFYLILQLGRNLCCAGTVEELQKFFLTRGHKFYCGKLDLLSMLMWVRCKCLTCIMCNKLGRLRDRASHHHIANGGDTNKLGCMVLSPQFSALWMVAKSWSKLLSNIIALCSWLRGCWGKCTVAIMSKSMYRHCKIHADTGPKLFHLYFQRLSLPCSEGGALCPQLVWWCCWWDTWCWGLLPPKGWAFSTIMQWFLKSMWLVSLGIVSKLTSPGFLGRMLGVCFQSSRRNPRNFTESGERQLKRDMGSSKAFNNPQLSHLAPGLSPELLIHQLEIASPQGPGLPEKSG